MTVKQRMEIIRANAIPFLLKSLQKIRLNRKLITFGLFLAVAAIFWLLNALSLNYTTTLRLKYILSANNNSDLYLTGKESEGEIALRVNAPGFALLQYNLFYGNTQWKINITNLLEDQFRAYGKNGYYLILGMFNQEIKQVMPPNFQILDVEPDSVYFTVGIYSKRNIAVKVRSQITTDYQFKQTGLPKVEPDSVMAWGPSQLLDTLQNIYTEKIVARNLSSSTKYKVKLELPRQISTTQQYANVAIQVTEYTEYNCISKINYKNQLNHENILLIPSTVKISCWVPVNLYHKIVPSDFDLYVDFNKRLKNSGKLKVDIARMPDSVINIKYSPEYVEYLFTKH